MLYSQDKGSLSKDVIKKIIRRGKYIYSAVLDLLKNKSASKSVRAVKPVLFKDQLYSNVGWHVPQMSVKAS